MSNLKNTITELKTDEKHWNYARGKAAQLKLAFKNKKAELNRGKIIQAQLEREQHYKGDDSAIRYDALHAAAYFAGNGWL